MRILVIGGMHGNEPLGPSVVKMFEQCPSTNVDTLIANPAAYKNKTRFVDQDLNRSFPGKTTGNIEQKRALSVLKVCKGYDAVLDFHNTHCPNNDCTFVGQSANELLYGISSYFKLKRVVVADYECVNKYVPSCISIEISLTSSLNNPDLWYQKIIDLSELISVPVAKNLETYRFAYRMTTEDRDRLGLADRKLKAFMPIDSGLAAAIGVQTPAFPIFINDAYTPYNFGGLLNVMYNKKYKS